MPDAMRAHDLKPRLQWDQKDLGIGDVLTSLWVAEEKFRGCRAFLELGEQTNRFAGTRSASFPYLRDAVVPKLAGTVLDGEFVAAVPEGASQQDNSSGLFNSGPQHAANIMRLYGRPTLWVFDVLSVKGTDVTRQPLRTRREHLELVVAILAQQYPASKIKAVQPMPATARSIRSVLQRGGEGVVLKKQGSLYWRGRRSWDWLKVKGASTADGFITGWRPGEGYNRGTVGSLELSIHPTPRTERVIAYVGIPPALRKQVTAADGSLRREWYRRVIEFSGHGIGSGGMVNIPIFIRVRDDKTHRECSEDQLEIFAQV
jgi:ATP-dependent DNA ligase